MLQVFSATDYFTTFSVLVVFIKSPIGVYVEISQNRLGNTGFCLFACFVLGLLNIWCSLGNEFPEIETHHCQGAVCANGLYSNGSMGLVG